MKRYTATRRHRLLLPVVVSVVLHSINSQSLVHAHNERIRRRHESDEKTIERGRDIVNFHYSGDKSHIKPPISSSTFLHELSRRDSIPERHIRRRVDYADASDQQSHLPLLRKDIHHIKREISASNAKNSFVRECLSFHTTSPVIDDSQISQLDYTDFLIHVCILTKTCPTGYDTSFGRISVFLQLKFLWLSCTDDLGLDDSCVDRAVHTISNGGKFGIAITDDNKDEVKEKIESFCAEIWSISFAYHGGVAVPTPSPTPLPSSTPSEIPYVRTTPAPKPIDPTPRKIESLSGRETATAIAAAGLILICMYIGLSRKGEKSDGDKDDTVLGSRQVIDQNETRSTLFLSPDKSEDDANQISKLDSAMMDGDWGAMASIAGRLDYEESSVGSSSYPVNDRQTDQRDESLNESNADCDPDELDNIMSESKWSGSREEGYSDDSKSSGQSSIFNLVINRKQASSASETQSQRDTESSHGEDEQNELVESSDSISDLFNSDTSTLSSPSGPSSSSTELISNKEQMLEANDDFYSQRSGISSQSKSSSDEDIPSHANSNGFVRRLFGRFLPSSRNSEYSNLAQSELALQEDSSASSLSWGQAGGGSSEDDTLTKPGKGTMKGLSTQHDTSLDVDVEVNSRADVSHNMQSSVQSSFISLEEDEEANTKGQDPNLSFFKDANQEDNDTNIDDLYSVDDSRTSYSSSAMPASSAVESIDGDKIASLEQLIEADDWQGIVPYAANTTAEVASEVSTIASPPDGENSTAGISFGTSSLPNEATSEEDQSFRKVWQAMPDAGQE